MVATTGAQLLPEEAVKTLCKELLPQTFLLTPNIPEANLIVRESGRSPVDVQDLEGLKRLAANLHDLGVQCILLKGGHIPLTSDHKIARSDNEKQVVVNVLCGRNMCEVIESPYQNSKNTHGTGCSLASAIACNLANGQSLPTAVRAACRYIDAGIRMSPDLGQGSGPLNHFHSLQTLPFSPGTFIDYILDREDVKPAWHEYTHHQFVRQMGDGSLPEQAFKNYMIQDYLYLIHFARANALAGYKTKSLDDIAGAAAIVTHIRHEINLHIEECEQFGLTQEDMEKCEESQACTAYSRYVLDIGQSEDWLALQIALLPCLLGYGMIAARLKAEQEGRTMGTANRYQTWIDNYVAEDYVRAVQTGRGERRLSAGRTLLYADEVYSADREACREAVADEDRGAGQDLCACYEGTLKAKLNCQDREADMGTDGDRVLGHGRFVRVRNLLVPCCCGAAGRETAVDRRAVAQSLHRLVRPRGSTAIGERRTGGR